MPGAHRAAFLKACFSSECDSTPTPTPVQQQQLIYAETKKSSQMNQVAISLGTGTVLFRLERDAWSTVKMMEGKRQNGCPSPRLALTVCSISSKKLKSIAFSPQVRRAHNR